MTVPFRTWAITAIAMMVGWSVAGGEASWVWHRHDEYHRDWRDDPDVRCLKMPNNPPRGALIGFIGGPNGEVYYQLDGGTQHAH